MRYTERTRMNGMVNLRLNYGQVKELVAQLSPEEKEELARYLDDRILLTKFRRFRDEMKEIPLTEEEITHEVDEVREARYRAGHHRH